MGHDPVHHGVVPEVEAAVINARWRYEMRCSGNGLILAGAHLLAVRPGDGTDGDCPVAARRRRGLEVRPNVPLELRGMGMGMGMGNDLRRRRRAEVDANSWRRAGRRPGSGDGSVREEERPVRERECLT